MSRHQSVKLASLIAVIFAITGLTSCGGGGGGGTPTNGPGDQVVITPPGGAPIEVSVGDRITASGDIVRRGASTPGTLNGARGTFMCESRGCSLRTSSVSGSEVRTVTGVDGITFTPASTTPTPPPPTSSACSVGGTLSAGQSCSHTGGGGSFTFTVRADGFGCVGGICSGRSISLNNFSARRNSDGEWEIVALPGVGSGTPPPSGVPDLVWNDVRVSDPSLSTSQSFTLSVSVQNIGTGEAPATTLRYYRSTNPAISTSDTQVGTDAVDALSISDTRSESISLTAPSIAGTYYYGACVDSVAGESDTRNNCTPGVRVTVSGGGSGGNTFGTGSALPGVPTSGIFIPAITSGASVSAGGGSTTITFNNGGYVQLQSGARYSCRATGGCQVRNGVVTRGTIESGGGTTPPQTATAPDLVVTFAVSDRTPSVGDTVELRATVRNRGDGRSAATTLRYYRSSSPTISTSDFEWGTDAVSSLAASDTSRELGLLGVQTTSDYYWGACVDTVSGESDTANNCSSAVRVTVSGGGGGGACTAGLVVNPGGSCTYKGQTFSVSASGRGSIAFFSAGTGINAIGTRINGVLWNFRATKNSGSNSWTIHRAD